MGMFLRKMEAFLEKSKLIKGSNFLNLFFIFILGMCLWIIKWMVILNPLFGW
ncbi:unnamed protein product, partial [Vitis vinifera]